MHGSTQLTWRHHAATVAPLAISPPVAARSRKHLSAFPEILMRSTLLAAFAATLLLAPVSAFAQAQQNFSLVNRSGAQIDEVYVSPSSSNNWGRDILGDGVMPSGTRRNITFPQRTRACAFDLRVVFEGGRKSEASNLNLCEISTITVQPSGRFATE
jgi:hypothetical protein